MSKDEDKTGGRIAKPKASLNTPRQNKLAGPDTKACLRTRKTYQEPLDLPGPNIFGDDDRREEVEAAFQAFKQVCEQDRSPIGLALRKHYEIVFPDFARLWRNYDDARKAEDRAARVRVKPEFVALGLQVDGLRSTLSELDDNPNLRRYLTEGLLRQIGMSAQASSPEVKVLIQRVTSDLDLLSQVCQSEAELQHQPGEREDTTLVRASDAMRQLILCHSGVRVPKSIAIVRASSFENVAVEILYQFMRCVDPHVTPSQVKTALHKLPPLPKSAKILS